MFGKNRAVGGEEVAVVHREGAAGERGVVVCNTPRRRRIGVGVDHHRLPVVPERGAFGGDDATRGEIVIVGEQSCADPAEGVLNRGPVFQLHGTLVLRQLPFGPVAHHLDALPHHAVAGGGQRAAVDDEFAAGTDDDTGR